MSSDDGVLEVHGNEKEPTLGVFHAELCKSMVQCADRPKQVSRAQAWASDLKICRLV